MMKPLHIIVMCLVFHCWRILISPNNCTTDNINEAALLLAKAKNSDEIKAIGNQTGGRVGFFLYVDDFDTVYNNYSKNGVQFLEKPRGEAYGKVVVFQDLYGNKWDLIEAP